MACNTRCSSILADAPIDNGELDNTVGLGNVEWRHGLGRHQIVSRHGEEEKDLACGYALSVRLLEDLANAEVIVDVGGKLSCTTQKNEEGD